MSFTGGGYVVTQLYHSQAEEDVSPRFEVGSQA
jgi:hypothetical protein